MQGSWQRVGHSASRSDGNVGLVEEPFDLVASAVEIRADLVVVRRDEGNLPYP